MGPRCDAKREFRGALIVVAAWADVTFWSDIATLGLHVSKYRNVAL
jgi:hypothetical protein